MNIHRTLLLAFLAFCGCGDSPKPEGEIENDGPAASPGPLTVLVLDDKSLGNTIKRQWTANSEAEVELQQMPMVEFLATESKPAADVVIYPSGFLGEMAEGKWIQPIPERVLDHPSVDSRDILPLDRGPNVTWGKKVYAFSFGSPTFVLFYRRDLFDQLGLSPPKTWEAYRELAERLHDRSKLGDAAPPEEQPWSGTVEPLAPGWAAQTLVARSASYVRHRSRYSALFNYTNMEPMIDRQPFVKALRELAGTAPFGPEATELLTPDRAREAILNGECAMAISWPSAVGKVSAASDEEKNIPVSVAALPGSKTVYNFTDGEWEERDSADDHVPVLAIAGRLGSISSRAKNQRGALNMLAKLSGRELGTPVSTQSSDTAMFRTSQLARASEWMEPAFDSDAAREYETVFTEVQNSRIWLYAIRIPGRVKYLNSLDEAVQQVLAEEAKPAEQLKAVAKKWRELTEQIGSDSQREAYRNSLGL